MKISLPVDNIEVWLPSTGLAYRRATLHKYSHSETITVRCGARMVTGVGHFYRCTETDEVRQYGFDREGIAD